MGIRLEASLSPLPSSLFPFLTTTTTNKDNDNNNNSNNNNKDLFSTPLPLHTFAGQVEQALKDLFPESEITRVLQCWRRLEADCEYKAEVVEEEEEEEEVVVRKEQEQQQDNDDDNEDNKKSKENLRIQQCHSYVPGLSIREFWPIETFDWAIRLQEEYGTAICEEFARHVTTASDKERRLLQEQGNNIWSTALTEEAVASYGQGWKTLVLMDRGIWDETNVQLFPITAKAVYDANVPAVEVFFASMDAYSSIPTHSDYTNFVLTTHLGVSIPKTTTTTTQHKQHKQQLLHLRVGNVVKHWNNGKVLVFDTSLFRNAVNQTPETRYILMMRVWHPDLTVIERQALQFIWDCLETPALATTTTTTTTMTTTTTPPQQQQQWQDHHDPEQQQQVLLQQVAKRREFPTLLGGTKLSSSSSSSLSTATHTTNNSKKRTIMTTPQNNNNKKGFGSGSSSSTGRSNNNNNNNNNNKKKQQQRGNASKRSKKGNRKK